MIKGKQYSEEPSPPSYQAVFGSPIPVHIRKKQKKSSALWINPQKKIKRGDMKPSQLKPHNNI